MRVLCHTMQLDDLETLAKKKVSGVTEAFTLSKRAKKTKCADNIIPFFPGRITFEKPHILSILELSCSHCHHLSSCYCCSCNRAVLPNALPNFRLTKTHVLSFPSAMRVSMMPSRSWRKDEINVCLTERSC